MGHFIKEQFLVTKNMVFFLIVSSQIGIGILSYQRSIVKSAGYDAWISVIMAGLLVHVLIWLIYKVLDKEGTDVIDVHQNLYGKWIGGLFSLIIMIYFLGSALTILRSYIEIVQVWLFPELGTWILSLFLIVLLFMIVNGGFRAVTGMCVLGFLIPFPLFILLLFPLEFANYLNVLPIWKNSLVELINGARDMTLNYIGFEFLLIYYPFIKEAKDSQAWAQLGALFTMALYTGVMMISLLFYSEEQLNRTIWATLTLYKIVEMPFIERFEYIVISLWMLLIIPNLVLGVWAVTRIAKKQFTWNQRISLGVVLFVLFVFSIFFEERHGVSLLNEYLGRIGFGIIYFYIPFLYVSHLIISKVRSSSNEA
ncbi:GerAB/ArcD/ProY family transporter [Bacillus alkalicellulosilyticus]|uniref:GerAB/ArcD/ProY family transporter n=1 Tax=Alkalihalobacterium alkalicellulosilyticum TaxID=1912214 RepID=UPI0009975D8C|nr:GerAB/ArcD/ProY family transporter [Bacillus alkalicellulosilyticus]